MRKLFLFISVFFTLASSSFAQEIQARLTVTAGKIGSQVDKKIFQTLQTALVNFVNNRKWTNDAFKPAEKIQCNFLLSIEQDLSNNIYKGKLTVQAARPVFNSSYDSPV